MATKEPGCVGQFCCWPEYVVKSAMAQPETRVVMIAAASSVLWRISFVFNEPHVVSGSSREGKYVD